MDSFPDRFEDSIIQWVGYFCAHNGFLTYTQANQKESLLDATQEGKDGKDSDVFIKRVDSRTHPNEIKIASRLGSADNRKDKRNHCVLVLAVFPDDRDLWCRYIVMPVLRPFNEPNFTSLGEVLDFVNQTLEVSVVSFSYPLVKYFVFRALCICTNKTWHIGG